MGKLYLIGDRKSLLVSKMADDSRDRTSSEEPGSHLPASTPSTDPKKPKHEFPKTQVGKLWDAFGDPEDRVNVLANATYKPPGKDANDVSYSDVVGNMSMSEISSFYKAPCARESLLTGIGVGFGIGGVRGIFGGIHRACGGLHWMFGLIGSFRVTLIMGCWELGCWSVCSHVFGSLRTLSPTTDRGIARNETSS